MRFLFRVTDWKALKYLIIPIVKSRRAWNWWKNKKDVNGTKFTGWNVPDGKRGQPFQTNRSFRKSYGWAVEICLFHLLSVWNHRNFHVNGKQPWILAMNFRTPRWKPRTWLHISSSLFIHYSDSSLNIRDSSPGLGYILIDVGQSYS
jgi:hypothetical protein